MIVLEITQFRTQRAQVIIVLPRYAAGHMPSSHKATTNKTFTHTTVKTNPRQRAMLSRVALLAAALLIAPANAFYLPGVGWKPRDSSAADSL